MFLNKAAVIFNIFKTTNVLNEVTKKQTLIFDIRSCSPCTKDSDFLSEPLSEDSVNKMECQMSGCSIIKFHVKLSSHLVEYLRHQPVLSFDVANILLALFLLNFR